MTTFKVGDVIGDCADVKCNKPVAYGGNNSATCQGCGSTYNVSFEDGEEAEQPPVAPETPAPPAPVAPTAAPPAPVVPEARPAAQPIPTTAQPASLVAGPSEVEDAVLMTPPLSQPLVPLPGIEGPVSAMPVEPIIDGGTIGELVEVSSGSPSVRKKQLELDSTQVGITASATQVDLPDYIKSSRPWKWAQQMAKSGNPYRQNTKSWKIFQLFSNQTRTLEDAVVAYAVDGNDTSKMSYLLTIYEVVTQCIAAGLLLIEQETRIIRVCQGQPQARQMP